jgi:hypothetical protein
VFCRKIRKFEEAIKVFEQTLELEKRYFTIHDERKFGTLINLACCFYENRLQKDGDAVTKEIMRSCPSEQLRELARANKVYYQSQTISDSRVKK